VDDFSDAIHGMGFFSRPAETVLTVPREKSREEQIAELGAEIAAAKKEVEAAAFDENHYRATHHGHEKIFNGQFQISVNAMQSDLANASIQRRIRRTREGREKLSVLCARLADLKSPGWRVQ
jgi:hypothetical protein